MLALQSIVAAYGGRAVLRSVSFAASAGQVTGLIGHNGAGKSTLLRVIAGVLPCESGRVELDAKEITKTALGERLEMGIAYVPQGNRVFSKLTVRENLIVGVGRSGGPKGAAAAEKFPALTSLMEKPAGLLSGGEKQMLVMAMALSRRPRVLLLDEPSLGLSSVAATKTMELVEQTKRDGMTVVIAEQNVGLLLGIADRICALRSGTVVFDGTATELDEPEMRRIFL